MRQRRIASSRPAHLLTRLHFGPRLPVTAPPPSVLMVRQSKFSVRSVCAHPPPSTSRVARARPGAPSRSQRFAWPMPSLARAPVSQVSPAGATTSSGNAAICRPAQDGTTNMIHGCPAFYISAPSFTVQACLTDEPFMRGPLYPLGLGMLACCVFSSPGRMIPLTWPDSSLWLIRL